MKRTMTDSKSNNSHIVGPNYPITSVTIQQSYFPVLFYIFALKAFGHLIGGSQTFTVNSEVWVEHLSLD